MPQKRRAGKPSCGTPKNKRAKHDEPEQSCSTRGTVQQKEGDMTSFFMAMAHLIAQRSEDQVTQVGACIVNKKEEIVALGFNQLPEGYDKSHWEDKKGIVIHAEADAFSSLCRESADLKGGCIYVTLHPCDECAKLIIDFKIKKVIYFSSEKNDKKRFTKSARMLEDADVEVRHYNFKKEILDVLNKAKDGVMTNAEREADA